MDIRRRRHSVAVSTYQAGKLVLIGWNGRQVTVLSRDFQKPLGLAVDGDRLALSCRHQVIIFANADMLTPRRPELHAGQYNTLFLPHTIYPTGDLNIHDIAFSGHNLWMVNTRFSCLSKLTNQCNLLPQWPPPS